MAVGVWCVLSSISSQAADDFTLLRTGFETEKVVPSGQSTYDWLLIRLPSGQTGRVAIGYEGGTPEDRFARIVPDPMNARNGVLQYWLKHASIPGEREGYYKGRVQMNLEQINKTEVFERHRMYLHPDLNLYRSYPDENRWFNIGTMWVGETTHPHRFMISLDLVKSKGDGKPLYFMITGDVRTGGSAGHGQWQTIWGKVNTEFEVPVGEWMDVAVAYKQGDGKSGRYYLGVRRKSDASMTTIFDITNWTYSPEAPEPMPLTNWNPFKLYTSGAIIDHIRSRGGVAQIYWDNLQIWAK